jgi:hypothetical protein
MDWFGAWEPVPYVDIKAVEPSRDAAMLTGWLILAIVALVVGVMWYRHRAVSHSFWCATVGRDVEARFRLGRVLSCSAFDDPTAIACGRRCVDRIFRVQWPPALPLQHLLYVRGNDAARPPRSCTRCAHTCS